MAKYKISVETVGELPVKHVVVRYSYCKGDDVLSMVTSLHGKLINYNMRHVVWWSSEQVD